MKILDYTHLWENLYYKEKTTKTKLFLHHTAGLNIFGSELWLRRLSSKAFRENNYYIGVHYYISLYGEVMKSIPEENWAWHSGTGTPSIDKSSIAIELENLGFLKEINSKEFIDLYNNKWVLKQKKENGILILKNALYPNQTIEIKKYESWRNYEYYHLYSEEQIKTLIQLCREIFSRNPLINKKIYNINFFLPENNIFPKVINFSGVVTHVQFLDKNKKWDLSIAFSEWYNSFVKELNLNIV